jgi:hypothetical protein
MINSIILLLIISINSIFSYILILLLVILSIILLIFILAMISSNLFISSLLGIIFIGGLFLLLAYLATSRNENFNKKIKTFYPFIIIPFLLIEIDFDIKREEFSNNSFIFGMENYFF